MSRVTEIALLTALSLSLFIFTSPSIPPFQLAWGQEQGEPVEVTDIRKFLEPDDYTYDPQGKRDPFKSLISVKNWELGKKIGLERFDLTEVKVTGVVDTQKGPIAIVEAPNRKSYFVKLDDAMGLNEGKVVRISTEGVIIEERLISDFGEATMKTITLPLHEKKP